MRFAFNIAGFLALAAGAALVLHLFIANDNIRILAFVVLLGLLAVFYPRFRRTTLNKEAVDLIYYGIGMLAATVVFLGQDIERERLTIQKRDEKLGQRQRELRAGLANFNFVAENDTMLLTVINKEIDSKIKSLEQNRDEGFCKPERIIELRYRVEQLRSMNLKDEAVSAENELLHIIIMCRRQSKQLEKAASDLKLKTKNLAATKRLVSLLELNEPVKIGDRVLAKAETLELLEHVREDGWPWRQAVVQQVEEIAQKRDGLQSDLENLDIKNRNVFKQSREFLEFYWPYILITFLGMKIARYDYLSGRRAQRIVLIATSPVRRLSRWIRARAAGR